MSYLRTSSQVRQVQLKKRERLLVILASQVRTWRQALPLVKLDTLLGWHRSLFRIYLSHFLQIDASQIPTS